MHSPNGNGASVIDVAIFGEHLLRLGVLGPGQASGANVRNFSKQTGRSLSGMTVGFVVSVEIERREELENL